MSTDLPPFERAQQRGRPRRVGAALLLVALVLLGASPAQGQSVDSLFAKARSVAFEDGDYEEARAIAYEALDRSPNYHGIRVFAARTLAWEGQREKARDELRYVLERDPDHYEGLKAMIDVQTWSDRPNKALQYANQALEHHPDDPYFMRKRAAALRWLDRPDAALAQLNAVLATKPSDKEAQRALRDLKQEQMRHTVSVTYRRDAFRGSRLPWSFGTITLGRSTSIGSVIGRVRYANRFSTGGLQYSIDAYPSIMSGLYAYVNAGVSASSIFPDYRFGLSLYKSLPRSFSAELGTRYLNFGGGGTFVNVASLSKYYGNYLFKVATYVTPSSSGTSVSAGGEVRRYFGGAQTYASVSGSVGSSASDPMFEEDLQRQSSWGVSASGQLPLNYRTLVSGSAGYDVEELRTRTIRRFSFSLSLTYEF